MLENKEITAIIPARKDSKRIKSKNLLKLNNETLIERKIRQLQKSNIIDRVVLGSDSEEMLAIAKKTGAEAIRRPDYYCDEEVASANEMIKNMCELIKTDVVVWAHCTNPLIEFELYDKAIKTFFENLEEYDSLLSVVELKEHLWKDGEPFNYNPYAAKHIPARDLPPLYMQDGGIFIQPYEQMKRNSYFFGNKPYLFVVPQSAFLDINNMRDYILAKSLTEGKNNETKEFVL